MARITATVSIRKQPKALPIQPAEEVSQVTRTSTEAGIRTWARNECRRREAANPRFTYCYSMVPAARAALALAVIALSGAACAPREVWVRASDCRALAECQTALVDRNTAPARMAEIERVSRMGEAEVRAELARR